jgi:hypothetical protein
MSDGRHLRAGAIGPALPLFSNAFFRICLSNVNIGHDLLQLPIEIKRPTRRIRTGAVERPAARGAWWRSGQS